jgi:serpin B
MSRTLFDCITTPLAKTIGACFLLAGGIAALSCPGAAADTARRSAVVASVQDISQAESADREFAMDLYHQLAKEHPGENLFFSPISISNALLIAAEGASGETAEQMGEVLHLPAALRTTGSHAAATPWQFAAIHKGQAAINYRLSPRKVSPQTRQKIEQLRRDLKAANERAMHATEPKDAETSRNAAFHLAAQLNELLATMSGYEWNASNALWGERTCPFQAAYTDSIRSYYGGVLFPIDFRMQHEAARRQINNWVERQTSHRIHELLPGGSVNGNTKLVITNTVYFKGEWLEPFQPADTRTMDFHLAHGKRIPTKMMSQETPDGAGYAAFNGDGSSFVTPQQIDGDIAETDPYLYPDANGFTMVELPYKGDKLSMVVIVPQSADGLAKLEQKLTSASLQDWIGRLEQRPAHAYLPKFKMEAKYTLNGSLKSLGMTRAFIDPGKTGGAQFDRMASGQRMSISDVLHQTFVDVDEKGTEAAAATAVVCLAPLSRAPSRMKPFVPNFVADKPFLFVICDKQSHNILFLGRMLTPPAATQQ